MTKYTIWEEHFNNLPEDWDILRINSLRGSYEEDYCNNENYWTKQQNLIWGTGFYILNRKGMKYMIDSIDNYYTPIDHPLTILDSEVNIYLPKIELSLCLEDSYNSDIRGNCENYKDLKRFNKEDYIENGSLKASIFYSSQDSVALIVYQ